MSTLTRAQFDRFWEQGYIVTENAVTPAQLEALNATLDEWIEESCGHAGKFGETVDGKARFDLEASHTPEHPRLRRINNPVEISEVYRDVMINAHFVDIVADLIGPDVKFRHCKINVKMPGSTDEAR